MIRLPVGVFPLLQRRTTFIALTVLPSVSCIPGQVAGPDLRFLSLGLTEHCSAGITADVLGVFRKFFPAISASMLSFQFVTLLLLSGFFLFSSAPLPCASLIPPVPHRAFVAEGAAVERIRILLVALCAAASGFVISVDFRFCHGMLSNVAGMAGFGPACNWFKARCLTAWLHPRVERIVGVEPALSVWKTDVLPLNYIRIKGGGRRYCTMRPRSRTFVARRLELLFTPPGYCRSPYLPTLPPHGCRSDGCTHASGLSKAVVYRSPRA